MSKLKVAVLTATMAIASIGAYQYGEYQFRNGMEQGISKTRSNYQAHASWILETVMKSEADTRYPIPFDAVDPVKSWALEKHYAFRNGRTQDISSANALRLQEIAQEGKEYKSKVEGLCATRTFP